MTARDPYEIWRPLVDEKYTFSYDPGWARVVEFYCPGCAHARSRSRCCRPGIRSRDDIRLDLDVLEPESCGRRRSVDVTGEAAAAGGGRGATGLAVRADTDDGRGAATGATIDVDIGGTFTDCFVRLAGRPHGRGEDADDGLSPRRRLHARAEDAPPASSALERRRPALGDGTIRYSTTVAMNTLLQRTGRASG